MYWIGWPQLLLLLQLTNQVVLGNNIRIEIANASSDLNYTMPTDYLTVEQVQHINLPVWYRVVVNAAIGVYGEAGSELEDDNIIRDKIAGLIDPDLAVHVCGENGTITLGKHEDRNRYLDICFEREGNRSRTRRVVVAEDSSKAVNYPLEFNVMTTALRIDGNETKGRGCIGENLDQKRAAACVDEAKLDWVNSSMIDTVISTTRHWHWKPCEKRIQEENQAEGSRVGSFASFQHTLKQGILSVSPRKVSASFGDPISSDSGISLSFDYALCGHLMEIPVTIELVQAA